MCMHMQDTSSTTAVSALIPPLPEILQPKQLPFNSNLSLVQPMNDSIDENLEQSPNETEIKSNSVSASKSIWSNAILKMGNKINDVLGNDNHNEEKSYYASPDSDDKLLAEIFNASADDNNSRTPLRDIKFPQFSTLSEEEFDEDDDDEVTEEKKEQKIDGNEEQKSDGNGEQMIDENIEHKIDEIEEQKIDKNENEMITDEIIDQPSIVSINPSSIQQLSAGILHNMFML